MKLDIQKTFEALSNDPEFIREIRYYDGTLRMNMGEDSYQIVFSNGTPVCASDKVPAPAYSPPVKTEITGTDDMWKNLLARKPVPYYQCLQTTCVKHGMQMTSNVETLAYLPAWNRMVFVLRDIVNA